MRRGDPADLNQPVELLFEPILGRHAAFRLLSAQAARPAVPARARARPALQLLLCGRWLPVAGDVDATHALALKLAQGPRIALKLMNRNFNAAESGTLSELLDLESRYQIETGLTEDHREAARAFAEKRASIFRGR